jgi:hypothetical protein
LYGYVEHYSHHTSRYIAFLVLSGLIKVTPHVNLNSSCVIADDPSVLFEQCGAEAYDRARPV